MVQTHLTKTQYAVAATGVGLIALAIYVLWPRFFGPKGSGSYTITILDSATGAGIPFATVNYLGQQTMTDGAGRVYLSIFGTGICQVVALGYNPLSQSLTTQDGQNYNISLVSVPVGSFSVGLTLLDSITTMPIVGQPVDFVDAAGVRFTGMTDSNGLILFANLNQAYNAAALHIRASAKYPTPIPTGGGTPLGYYNISIGSIGPGGMPTYAFSMNLTPLTNNYVNNVCISNTWLPLSCGITGTSVSVAQVIIQGLSSPGAIVMAYPTVVIHDNDNNGLIGRFVGIQYTLGSTYSAYGVIPLIPSLPLGHKYRFDSYWSDQPDGSSIISNIGELIQGF